MSIIYVCAKKPSESLQYNTYGRIAMTTYIQDHYFFNERITFIRNLYNEWNFY